MVYFLFSTIPSHAFLFCPMRATCTVHFIFLITCSTEYNFLQPPFPPLSTVHYPTTNLQAIPDKHYGPDKFKQSPSRIKGYVLTALALVSHSKLLYACTHVSPTCVSSYQRDVPAKKKKTKTTRYTFPCYK